MRRIDLVVLGFCLSLMVGCSGGDTPSAPQPSQTAGSAGGLSGGASGGGGADVGAVAGGGGSVGAVAGGGGQGGTSEAGGTAGTAGSGGAVMSPEGIWPTYEEAAASPLSTKTLVVLIDFTDTNADEWVPNAEAAWAEMIFGTARGQGNNYWYETSAGQFQLLRAEETNGTPNDGLVRVGVSAVRPTGSGVVVEDQPWLTEALDSLVATVPFASFDTNGDTLLTNDELSVLVILDVPANVFAGADAQANIELGYPIPGTGVTLDMFARSLAMISAIGVPMHELAHHILDLDHFTIPSDHDLMGMGSYTEDPEVGNLHNPGYHAGTRPAGLHALNAVAAGLLEATPITDTTLGVELHSPELGQRRNAIELTLPDGVLFVENRTRWGYDQSIPFCEGSEGGLFLTEASQYVGAIGIPQITRDLAATEVIKGERDFCEYYAHAGHNDAFEYAGWRFENISAAGPTMTVDIIRTNTTPVVDHYKIGYWQIDPTRDGYRRMIYRRLDAVTPPNVDFSEMIGGDSRDTRVTLSLEAYYNTGVVRSHNHLATWTTDSPYVTVITDQTFINPNAFETAAISVVFYALAATPTPTATISVNTGMDVGAFKMINIPAQ